MKFVQALVVLMVVVLMALLIAHDISANDRLSQQRELRDLYKRAFLQEQDIAHAYFDMVCHTAEGRLTSPCQQPYPVPYHDAKEAP